MEEEIEEKKRIICNHNIKYLKLLEQNKNVIHIIQCQECFEYIEIEETSQKAIQTLPNIELSKILEDKLIKEYELTKILKEQNNDKTI